ncbi:carboxymuconolactone decarboxylase family protein [Microbispora sp. NPDC049125]|uniref:carboxymuconolactone decarboxylase family protein n=1 Tax=Microbispora sp. NPDC049125 TaxID=3154929 RepID=UPI0034673890
MAGPFRYVTPVAHEAATGRIAQVYAQLASDFGMARMPVFMTLSPAEDVLAGTWAATRESLLAGQAPRTGKEIVALAVSLANGCPFCVDAHTTLLHATGDHRLAESIVSGRVPDDPEHAALLSWAMATRGPAVGAPPVPAALAPEYVGTALVFHFINRIASALLTDNLLPANLQKSRLVRSLGGRAMSRVARRRLPEGASLPLLADLPAGPVPAWAAGAPIGTAFAVLRAAATAGGELLSERARAAVLDAVAAWDGEHPPMGGGQLSEPIAGLPAGDRPAARLALLTALAPYRVTDTDVSTWRGASGTDAELVRLVAFGAIAATERAESSITAALRPVSR